MRRTFVPLLAAVTALVPPVLARASADTLDVPGVAVVPVMSSPAAGTNHSCVVRDAEVWCTGANDHDQLAIDGTERTFAFAPSGVTAVESVAAGGDTTCAVKLDHTLWCWGSLPASLLPGSSTVLRTDSLLPVQVPLSDVRRVAVGTGHSCAVLGDGSLWCWGDNRYGQLGDGTRTSSVVPVRARITSVRTVDTGTLHTCAVRTTGSVWCWGSNKYGKVGTVRSTVVTAPVALARIRATTVTTGAAFSCAVSTSTRVRCWGRNNYGQLGVRTGTVVKGIVDSKMTGAVLVSAGDEFVCATSTSGASCWGRNLYGQLGNGSYIARFHPQRIVTAAAVGTIVSVATGPSHACAVTSWHGAMWCWGQGGRGQFGDGAATLRRSGVAVWPNGVTMKPIGTASSARIVMAGDISCNTVRRTTAGVGAAGSQCGADQTATQIQGLAPDAVIALGDLQYEGASYADMMQWYDPSWGRFKNITYPLRGNHEYLTSGAMGYVDYFGEMSPSYWTTDAGGWRVITVDSWCQGQLYAGCSANSVQTRWLRAQLDRAHAENMCAVVTMHHPLVSSGDFATDSVRHLWAAAVAGGADLVVTGHDHLYERFERLDADGNPTGDTTGTPLIISGLGGAQALPIGTPVPGSAFQMNTDHGVTLFTFTPTGYTWEFVSAVDGTSYDGGTGTCTP